MQTFAVASNVKKKIDNSLSISKRNVWYQKSYREFEESSRALANFSDLRSPLMYGTLLYLSLVIMRRMSWRMINEEM